MTGWKKRLAAVAVGATVLGTGIGLGATVFASGSAGAQGSSPSATEAGPAQPGPLFGVVHGDLSLRRYDGSTLALEYDRGVIVAREGDTLTVARMDGRQVTIRLTPTTIVREGLRLGSTGDLVVGDRAMFLSKPASDGTFTAVAVRCISGPRA